MTHGNAFDLAQPNSKIGAIANENGAFRTGIEQQGVSRVVSFGHDPQAEAKICAKECLSRNGLRAGKNDIGKLGHRKQGLANIGITNIVGHHIHDEKINGFERGRWSADLRTFERLSTERLRRAGREPMPRSHDLQLRVLHINARA